VQSRVLHSKLLMQGGDVVEQLRVRLAVIVHHGVSLLRAPAGGLCSCPTEREQKKQRVDCPA
jgi:hypothetical protein